MLKDKLLAPCRGMLEGPLASRWPPVREAVGALVTATDQLPLSAGDAEWLRGARGAFFAFAAGKFLHVEGGVADTACAAQLLDPFSGGPPASPALRNSLR